MTGAIAKPSFRDTFGHLFRRASGQELSVFGLIGASTGLASDIYEPILPSTLLWFLASVFGFAVCIYLFRNVINTKNWKEQIFGDGAIFFGASIPVICILMLAQQFLPPKAPADNESVLARMFPAVEGLQASIGAMDEKLASIDEGVAQIGSDVTEIKQDVKGLKKETSEDPRKELANMGILWSGENFLQAVADGDLRTIDLFLQGGMRPEAAKNAARPLPIMLAKNTFNADEVLERILEAGTDVDYAFPSGNISGPKSYTMLGWAIEKRNEPLIRSLAEHGADLNQELDAYGAYGVGAVSTPLAVSIGRAYLDTADMLLTLGADPAAEDYQAYRTLVLSKDKLGESDEYKALLAKLTPSSSHRAKIDAELRLIAIDKELTSVAMDSMRAFSVSEKQRLDARYNALQQEKKDLISKYNLE